MSEWTNLAPLMNTDVETVFADNVLYFPVVGKPVTVLAHFDEAFEIVDVDAEVPVTTTVPILDIILSRLSFMPRQDDEIHIGVGDAAQVYKVTDVQIDGVGGAKLLLVKQNV